MTGTAFEKLVNRGQPVRLQDIAVHGPVVLSHLTAPVSCRRCSFGSLVLQDAVVERVLDLRDLSSVGHLDAEGAEFRQPLLLGSVRTGCSGIAEADFFLATFDDVADFEGAQLGNASFAQTRFRGAANFSLAEFGDRSSFARSSFEQEARFDGAKFDQPADFTSASFSGRADFVGTLFGPQICFAARGDPMLELSSASFGAPADFGQSQFCGRADLRRTRFDGGATFIGTQFHVPGPPQTTCSPDNPPDNAATFDHVSSGGKLDFTAAFFGGTPQFVSVSAPAISLENAVYDRCVPIEIADLSSVGDLQLAPADADRVDDPATRIDVLRVIESSAKERGDLAVANDARYRVLDLTSDREGTVQRWANHAFYRDVAGYLVRPFNPILSLLVLALVASFLRALRARPLPPDSGLGPGISTPFFLPPARRRPLRRLENLASHFLTELTRTLSIRQRAPANASLLRKTEGATYAVLLACFLIGLANSNPTLKQIVDAVL